MKLVDRLKILLEQLSDLNVVSDNPLALVNYDVINYSTDQFGTKFKQRLQALGFPNIEVQVLNFDPDTGDLLIEFSDPQSGESVEVLFTISEDPLAVVVSQDDEPIEVNLSNFPIPMVQYTIGIGINWFEPLSWLTKSVVSALLQAGRLLEKYTPIRGSRREKLPLVRKGISEPTKVVLKRIKTCKRKRQGKLRVFRGGTT